MTSAELDKRYVWHPFTPMDEWLDPSFSPVMIASGRGAELTDEDGKTYLDGNSSIWTNIHGHNHPRINAAVKDQLERIAHCSYLGLGNGPASRLAEKLCQLISPKEVNGKFRAFWADNGSTAVETAVKIAYQYFQQNGQPGRTRFVSLAGGYHGDTIGAMSVGHSGSFHAMYQPLMFSSIELPSPGGYRCPDGCLGEMERVFAKHGKEIAAVVMEPRVQGPAGMVMHPPGYLRRVADLAKTHGTLLILDEVMTGMGRTGKMLACQHEDVVPDMLALAKGLTGGTLPFGATLVRETLFDGFRGELGRAFFHGHSYCGNPLGAAAALACLEIFEEERTLEHVAKLSKQMRKLSQCFWKHPHVGDVRQQGLILAVELVRNRQTREPFPAEARLAQRICEQARHKGLLTRGLGSILFLLPPLCTTEEQLQAMVERLFRALMETRMPGAT